MRQYSHLWLRCGMESAEQIRDEARLGHRSPEDIEEVMNALIEVCQSYVDAQVAVEENRASSAAKPSENEQQLNLKSVVLPASAEKVFASPSCKERIQRNAERYVLAFSYE